MLNPSPAISNTPRTPRRSMDGAEFTYYAKLFHVPWNRGTGLVPTPCSTSSSVPTMQWLATAPNCTVPSTSPLIPTQEHPGAANHPPAPPHSYVLMHRGVLFSPEVHRWNMVISDVFIHNHRALVSRWMSRWLHRRSERLRRWSDHGTVLRSSSEPLRRRAASEFALPDMPCPFQRLPEALCDTAV